MKNFTMYFCYLFIAKDFIADTAYPFDSAYGIGDKNLVSDKEFFHVQALFCNGYVIHYMVSHNACDASFGKRRCEDGAIVYPENVADGAFYDITFIVANECVVPIILCGLAGGNCIQEGTAGFDIGEAVGAFH